MWYIELITVIYTYCYKKNKLRNKLENKCSCLGSYLWFRCYLQYINPCNSLYFLCPNIKVISISDVLRDWFSYALTLPYGSLSLSLAILDFVQIAILHPPLILGYCHILFLNLTCPGQLTRVRPRLHFLKSPLVCASFYPYVPGPSWQLISDSILILPLVYSFPIHLTCSLYSISYPAPLWSSAVISFRVRLTST
jgi:hypothetical protein